MATDLENEIDQHLEHLQQGQSADAQALGCCGDIVLGLASCAPVPIPFVGEIEDLGATKAAEISESMARANGAKVERPVQIAMGGMQAAHNQTQAMPFNPLQSPGMPSSSLAFIDLGGRQFLTQGNPFQKDPTGSMFTLALNQRTVYAKGLRQLEELPEELADEAAAARGNVPVRQNWADPTAMNKILSGLSSEGLEQSLPREFQMLVGDPVDVATGAVVTWSDDYARQGPDLTFRREYNSRRTGNAGPFGHGWSHNFEQSLWLEPGRVVVQNGDLRRLEFDTMRLPGQVARAGDVLRDILGRFELRCHGHLHWELIERGKTRHFEPIPGESTENRDRGLARLTRVVRPLQPLMTLSYDKKARLKEVLIDGRPMLGFQYDQDDHIDSLWASTPGKLQRHTRFEYSAAGDLVASTDALGHRRVYEYEGHLLVKESNREGGSFHYGYDGVGARAKCVRAWGTGARLDRTLSYNGPTTSVTDSLGHRTIYDVDPLGMVAARVDPMGGRRSYQYDEALRLIVVRYEDKGTAKDHYDEHGNLVKKRDADGAVWRMVYDDTNSLTEGYDATGGKWSFSRDFEGKLSRVEDPEGHVTRIEYDEGRPCTIVDPMGRKIALQIGANDEVLSIQQPGRLPLRYEYDSAGRLTKLEQDATTVSWVHDAMGRVLAVESPTEFLRLERNADGHVTRIERPSERWELVRDLFGSVEVAHTGDDEVRYEYDTEGRLNRVRRNGRVEVELKRDARGLVDAYVLRGREDYVLIRESKSGRPQRRVRGGVSIQLSWDRGGRLTGFEDESGHKHEFDYRADGLLAAFSNDHSFTTLDRTARGIVTKQTHQGFEVRTAEIDHRGRRYGIDVQDLASMSLLWTTTGALDRVAVTAETTIDVSVDHVSQHHQSVQSGAYAVEYHTDAWGRDAGFQFRHGPEVVATGNQNWPAPLPAPPSPEPLEGPLRADPAPTGRADALLRPIGDDDARIVWDEDRIVMQGTKVVAADAIQGRALASVDGETMSLDPRELNGKTTLTEEERWYWSCFPTQFPRQGVESVCPTPLRALTHVVSASIWDPKPRPLAGEHPWLPDDWTAAYDGPESPDCRLDQKALMRLLSPFPRDPLRL